MTTASFFRDEDAPALYYARWMGQPDLDRLRADVTPHESLLIEDDGASSDGERRYLRLGSAGAASSLHFDVYHNTFVQLVGEKRWLLLPPDAWAEAWSFPRGHPRARQVLLSIL